MIEKQWTTRMRFKRNRANARPKLLWLAFLFFVFALFVIRSNSGTANRKQNNKVLVTYAYAERLGNGGEIDEHNFRFFIRVGMSGSIPGTEDPDGKVHYIFVISSKRSH